MSGQRQDTRPGMSPAAAPAELRWADPEDCLKIGLGLETRTGCCQRLVPTKCLKATCGHGRHVDRFGEREDGPCLRYRPQDVMFHEDCPRPRSLREAHAEADRLWEEPGMPRENLPEDSQELYRRLVRGDRTFPVDPPSFRDDVTAENWDELDGLLEDFLGGLRNRTPQELGLEYVSLDTPDIRTAARALRDYINEIDPIGEEE